MKLQYHGWLGAMLIPLGGIAFLITIFIQVDRLYDLLKMGISSLCFGATVTALGFILNKGAPKISRPKSRFAAPHELQYLRVQYWGIAVMLIGCVFVVIQYS